MKAYSLDLRERALAAVNNGTPRAEVLRIFQIAAATLTRYLKLQRTSDSVAPRPYAGGRPASIPHDQHAWLTELIEQDPDATLAQLSAAWAERTGVVVSQATMCRALKAIRWTRKKRV